MAHIPGFTPELLLAIDRIERYCEVPLRLAPIFKAILDSPYDHVNLRISQETMDGIVDQVYSEWDQKGFGTATIVIDDSLEFAEWHLEAQVNA
jgi:hypothetical protein